MQIVVTGAAGMLGRRVVRDAVARGWSVSALTRQDADLADIDRTHAAITDRAPDAIVNCAAYTDVDGAESDEPAALRGNRDTAHNVAEVAGAIGARLVHVSTDYVFDGTLTGRPYVESDPTCPLGAYGASKLAGEEAVAASCTDHAIVRTAWVFGAGGTNFCETMLRAAQTRDRVAVVTDQVGSPTWTGHLSPALLDLAATGKTGVLHVAGEGHTSWHGLTLELYAQAGIEIPVDETTTAAFPRPAARPAWSVLASERDGAPHLPPWQEGVRGFLNERGRPGT